MTFHRRPTFSLEPPARACSDSPLFHQSPVMNHESLSLLECALTNKHRVLPGFGRNWPPVTPLESALTKRGARKCLRMRTYKKNRGEGGAGGLPVTLSCYTWAHEPKLKHMIPASFQIRNLTIRAAADC